jgi:hypothetical protein
VANSSSKRRVHSRTRKKAFRYQQRWPGAYEAYAQILGQIRKNPEPTIFLAAAYLAVSLLTRYLHHGAVQATLSYQVYEYIFQAIILLALPTYGLALANRRHITIGEVMRFDMKKFVFLLLATIIYAVGFLCSVLLFVVPVIWIVGWLSLYQFPIVEEGMKPIDAFYESKRLCQDNKGAVWGVLGMSVILVIIELPLVYLPLISIILPAYTMFVIVISMGAMAELYCHLKLNDEAP